MKQHITIKQWNELSEKLKGAFADQKCFEDIISPHECNIGKMIEFLNESDDIYMLEGFAKLGKYREDELCDALWEAVKYKLKK